jgi:hypothetical protein
VNLRRELIINNENVQFYAALSCSAYTWKSGLVANDHVDEHSQTFVIDENIHLLGTKCSLATKRNFARRSNLLCSLYRNELRTGKFCNINICRSS